MQPGQMCSIASGKFCHSALFSRGRRKAPARATGPHIADNPGNTRRRGIAAASSRLALRLAGLQDR
ncbi:hypothetical protein EYY80_15820 [Klebsiella oxytoca]|nr:hypothetical protein HMPREF1569_2976 [Klebsiella oxytoca OK-1]TBL94556.1 hypothetical protein EYY80_15820 [Klebsiella oxytoca]